MTSSPRTKHPRFTVRKELRRYGLRWSDARLWLCWAVVALLLTFTVPFGQNGNIFQFLAIHIAFAGFGATVFGFTILGGKDDFFEPIIESSDKGVYVLRDMVLYLFFPLILHGSACVVLATRILFSQIGECLACVYLFRFAYAFLAIWAMVQTALSFRFLFVLAITRLMWKDKEVKNRKQAVINDGGHTEEQQDKLCSIPK